MSFEEHDVVRVIKLNDPNRGFIGSDDVMRPPVVGDTGTIVNILAEGVYVVECVAEGGCAVWIADFLEEELEAIQKEAK